MATIYVYLLLVPGLLSRSDNGAVVMAIIIALAYPVTVITLIKIVRGRKN